MQKIVTAIVALAVALCVTAWGLWVVPPADPIDYLHFKLNHHADATVGVTAAQAAEVCPPDMAVYRAGCVDHLTHPHFAAWESRVRFLAEVQGIPDEDCARMSEVLLKSQHLRDDGTLVKNARGGFNCDFARYGLPRAPSRPQARPYQCSPGSDLDLAQVMSASDYDVCVRKTYVTRPIYNLSRTRFSIVAGHGANGGRCIYTRIENGRLSDHWHLESCPEHWDF